MTPSDAKPVLALVGPTAAGKTEVAHRAALSLGAEIVSIDSGALYRGMDVGTEKPRAELRAEVAYHLIDVADVWETVTVAEFQQLARDAIRTIHSRGNIPLLVGGSGLYFRAVVDALEFPPTDPVVRAELEAEAQALGPEPLHRRLVSLDPAAASRMEPLNTRRIVRALEVIELTGRSFSSYRRAWDQYESIYDLSAAGLTWPRHELVRRVEARIDAEIERGLLEEVKELDAAGLRKSATAAQALGYSQLLAYLDGRLSFDEAVEEIKRRTRRFARRQLSWFREDPRVQWFEADPEGALQYLVQAGR